MRDSIHRLLPAWDDAMPSYGFLKGCQAFGLEETADYARAEAAGREAVERNPSDVWATHAVAHVMAMQGRHREGVAWLAGRRGGRRGGKSGVGQVQSRWLPA